MKWISVKDQEPSVGFRGLFELVNDKSAPIPAKCLKAYVACTVIKRPGLLGEFSRLMDVDFLPDDYRSPLLHNFKATAWAPDEFPVQQS